LSKKKSLFDNKNRSFCFRRIRTKKKWL